MPYKTLILDHEGRGGELAVLTLNRPGKRNSLSWEMMLELHSALDELEAGAARAVILTGAGKSFCSGMDFSVLKDMAVPKAISPNRADTGAAPSAGGLEDSKRIAALFRHFYTFSKPLIGAINGHAVAGGCGIATLCDFTLAASEARFGYPEVRIGFMPAFVAIFLIRQIGEKRARDLLLTGRILEAEEAREMGLVNEILPAERLLSRAREIAAELIALSPTSIRHTKRLLAGLFEDELDLATARAVQASAAIRSTFDFHEGVSAFLEKCEPRWRGI
ncbi:MAG: enoyl-CoA hydratase/isomerase family protein [Terriglobia bacterium]